MLPIFTQPFRTIGHFLRNQWSQPEKRYAWLFMAAVGAGVAFLTPLPYLAIGGIAAGSFVASYLSLAVGKELLSLYSQFRNFLTHTDETVLNINRRVSEAQASLQKVNQIAEEAQASMQKVDHIVEQVDAVAVKANSVATLATTAIDNIKDQKVPEVMAQIADVKAALLKNLQAIQPLLDQGEALLRTTQSTIDSVKAVQIPEAMKQLSSLREAVLANMQKMTGLMTVAEKTLTTSDTVMAKLQETAIPEVLKQIQALNDKLTSELANALANVTKEVTATTKSVRTALNKVPNLEKKLSELLDSAQVTVEGITPQVDKVVANVNGTMQEVHEALGGVNTGIKTVATFSAPATALASGLRTVGGWFGGRAAASTTPDVGKDLDAVEAEEEESAAEAQSQSEPAVAAPAAAETSVVPVRRKRGSEAEPGSEVGVPVVPETAAVPASGKRNRRQ